MINKSNINSKWKNWKAPKILFLFFSLCILILFIQFCYLGLSSNIYGVNIKEFASNRNTVTNILTAERGSIYDISGNVLAHNISSYTLIAHLDSSRTTSEDDPKHVVDKEYTATKLSTILGEDNYDYILERLNKKSKQVEFGKVGRNLTELTKLAIQELDLPGISFSETVQRYYPNGNFASYIIGYAKQYSRINLTIGEEYDLMVYYKNYFNNYDNVEVTTSDNKKIKINGSKIKALKEGVYFVYIKSNYDLLASIIVNIKSNNHDIHNKLDSTIVGELGIESKYESLLTGVDGFTIYQQDKYGYKIPDTPEIKEDAINGSDIYLTIDSSIQRFAETSITELESQNPDWAIVTVMDAKNGAILASATSPSYDPNHLSSDMSYQNPLVSYSYEPGSVMKIYTYMCALETGLYNGGKTYESGSYKVGDDTIHDWNRLGWGTLTYDVGFRYSSNTAIINIVKDYLSNKKLSECLTKFGFGKKTGIELSGETAGDIDFHYEIERYSAGFGQGISTTAVQQLQALSIVANDGYMISPHIISKVVDSSTKEEILTKSVKSKKLVSNNTISKIKDLMESVISKDSPTGSSYYLEGYDIIGKTGTAQIFKNGAYLSGSHDYIYSIGLMYPKSDPEIIIYAATQRPNAGATTFLGNVTKELVKNISKYRGMYNEQKRETDTSTTLDSYISKPFNEVENELSKKDLDVIKLGNGDIVVDQYPKKNTKVIAGDIVFLKTNGNILTMPDIKGWSRYNVLKLCELLKINVSFEGVGYVDSYNIKAGDNVEGKELKVVLKD